MIGSKLTTISIFSNIHVHLNYYMYALPFTSLPPILDISSFFPFSDIFEKLLVIFVQQISIIPPLLCWIKDELSFEDVPAKGSANLPLKNHHWLGQV